QSGYDVVLVDASDEMLERGLQRITRDLDQLVAKERLSEANRDEILTRIEGTTDIANIGTCPMVIEAVTESRETKLEVFKKIAETVEPDTVIASNTSSISIT